MTHGQLFGGIFGFGLAAQWAGIENVWYNEKEHYPCEVVRARILDGNIKDKVKIYEQDIRTIGKLNLSTVDIISGGFPCQPFSQTGNQKGVEDDRHLWPEMLRVIQEVGPRIVIAENVPAIDGMVLKEVLNDLEDSGYETLPPLEIEAASIGALHRRNRVWIVAVKENALHTNTNRIRSHKKEMHQHRGIEFQYEQIGISGSLVSKRLRKGIDPRVFRDIDGIPNRVDRLKGIGNAIDPRVAYELFRAIKETYN